MWRKVLKFLTCSRRQHEQRVVEEKKELDSKIKSLQNFIEMNDTFKAFIEEEKNDMREQLKFMQFYSLALQRRINRFI